MPSDIFICYTVASIHAGHQISTAIQHNNTESKESDM